MQNRIVLVSDDSDFFEYFIARLALRKSDELFRFDFDSLPSKVHMLRTSVLVINSENAENKTLELLKLIKNIPSIVFSYNENEKFRLNAYKLGVLSYVTPFTEDEDLQARIVNALNIASNLDRAAQYRELLVRSNLIMQNNDVFIDYTTFLDKELEKFNSNSQTAVLVAISPSDKTKLIQPNQLETIILNNIRKNDVLMNYATNKYFLLLYNTDLESAKQIWEKIKINIPEKIFAGFANVSSKSREQLVNEVLNRLHEAINYDKETMHNDVQNPSSVGGNFKIFRQEFHKKIEKIVIPVFYQVQQKYNDKLFGMTIEQGCGEGYSIFSIKSRHESASFVITSPGFAKINIDITYNTKNNIAPKRISLDPNELEAGLLEDLLEHFIIEYRKEISDDNS